ncbi:hypothetical protein LIA77_07658 [Sarocladium implicatum]|nr:hypothetical protein LIA77_07658 [Sarocladium implicatum]
MPTIGTVIGNSSDSFSGVALCQHRLPKVRIAIPLTLTTTLLCDLEGGHGYTRLKPASELDKLPQEHNWRRENDVTHLYGGDR